MNKHDDIAYALSPKDVTALARVIITHTDGSDIARSTYLRSLLAGVQVELIGRPMQRLGKAVHVAPECDVALLAFNKVNAIYYEAVLAAIPAGLNAEQRHSKTAFARSAASSLRRAIALGWNPLVPLHTVVKSVLTRWVSEHREPRVLTSTQAHARVVALIEKARAAVANLPAREANAAILAAVEEVTPGQKLRVVSTHSKTPEVRPH